MANLFRIAHSLGNQIAFSAKSRIARQKMNSCVVIQSSSGDR